MNITDQLVHLRKDLTNLNQILANVKEYIGNYENDVTLKGKTLRTANVEQPSLFGYYDEIRVHLQSLSDYIELKVVARHAAVLRYISENASQDYGERMKEKLVNEDVEYANIKLMKLETDEVLEMIKSICEQFKQRGYSLKNISNLVSSKSEDEFIELNG